MEKNVYKHYKGGLYEIIGMSKHTETGEEFVVYKPIKETPALGKNNFWIRPKDMFFDEVEIDGIKKPRFEKIK